MKISNFFIRRPIFAGVISIIIFVIGALAYLRLPLSEYPEVVPPTVVVRTAYPGANPTVIADTVASPLEQQINGVEGMLYMFSQSTADGVMTLTVTFALGTDLDKAQVQVQNRVSQALPRLPQEVQRLGVTTDKTSPDLLLVVHLTSPENRYDTLYLANLAVLQVKDELNRIPGVGDVRIFGAGDFSMRIWLNPNQLAAHNLTASDVVKSIREQNVQVAAGVLGAPPTRNGSTAFQLLVNTQGRLTSEEEFRNIIVRAGPDGEITRVRDVARVELGSSSYALRSLLDNKSAVAIPISQRPGSNALQTSQEVRETMARLKKSFPQGVDYSFVYDPTVFVRQSIEAVGHTFVEALLLVALVVLVFLQTWRASLIPLLALPVSLVGTFSVMLALGFSLNTLSLFGLVLAIGIVVDDAIVVVENVERHIEEGMAPREATEKAMEEVSGPIIAIALVLSAVFIPTAFIKGLSGEFYKQFALTIAISTLISAFNSLTLSPALAALLLQPREAKKDRLTRILDFSLGWFFKPFNRFFAWASGGYGKAVQRTLRASAVALVVYAALVGLTGVGFSRVPTGFVPTQDKQYLVALAQLPNGSTLDRTEDVIRKMSEIALKHPGVQSAVAFPGLSINGFTNSPNSGIVFVTLKPFEERRTADLSANALAGSLNQQFGAAIQEAFIAIFPPPPVQGVGTVAGFKLYIEDRSGAGLEALYGETKSTLGKGYQTKELAGVFSSFDINVPQIDSHVDREKAKTYGIALNDIFDTMQVYLGSLYVNDFNRFGRTYQVNVQAESPYRLHPEDIVRLKTRNAAGEMIPLGSVVKVQPSYGPDRVMHYNGFPAAEINGAPAPGYSSGQAEGAMAALLNEQLPNGMKFEWTELTYQKILAGNTMLYIFPLSVFLVYLVLAAQYESWSLPLVVILIVPMTLFSAIAGVWLLRGDNNVFTQISLIVLVGLACKNAILIVEFARERQLEGYSAVNAVLEACRLRLRPILMTSLAFTMGVVPLVLSSGAGSEMRQAIGIAVFFGMLGVTAFGLILTPVFYVVIQKFVEGREGRKSAATGALRPATSPEV